MRRRVRCWYVSPEDFRELRHSCLLSRKACAAYLGVSLRTVRYWDAGRNRVPWSVVRLLRVLRMGDLGALHDEWAGWTLNHLGLHAPAGRTYRERDMRLWWMTSEHAALFRRRFELPEVPTSAQENRADARICSGFLHRVEPSRLDGAAGPERLEGASLRPAACPDQGQVYNPAAPSQEAGQRAPLPTPNPLLESLHASAQLAPRRAASDRAVRPGRGARAARLLPGLVSSSKQVEREGVETRWRRHLSGVSYVR